MGGFMSFFSPQPVSTASVVVPSLTGSAADTKAEDERKARLAAVSRNRAGLAGTIATSTRGVLSPASGNAGRKSLLGE